MKTTTQRNYGVTGIRCDFNIMDCYEARHMVERIAAIHEDEKKGTIVLDNVSVELLSMLDMVSFFLEKIAIEPSEQSNMFVPKEEESAE